MKTTQQSKTSPEASASSRSNGHPPELQLEGVAKRYGQSEVLKPLSLAVQAGESVAIVGPSGAGKTTLLNLIAGSLPLDQGQVFLHGNDVSLMKPGRDLSRLVGIVAQQYDLVPHLSAMHNVLAGRLGEWSLWKSLVSLVAPRDRHLGIAALERVGVASKAHLRASKLSGGEQQRVAIARVLVQNPAILLADEPVSSLDPARAAEVLRLMVGIAREDGKTLVASIHAVDLARQHFGRVVGLRNGVVHFDVACDMLTDTMLHDLYDLQGLRSET
jgi:phosphonate transport system ATP-binding protein